MTTPLSKIWSRNNRPHAYASPCIIERMREPRSEPFDRATQYIIAQEYSMTYALLSVGISLQPGNAGPYAPDHLSPIATGLNAGDALTQVYGLLNETLQQVKKRTDAGIQCWPARTPQGFEGIRPLSTFGAEHPDLAPLAQKLASRWGQKAAPYRGHPRMGRPDLDFLFK